MEPQDTDPLGELLPTPASDAEIEELLEEIDMQTAADALQRALPEAPGYWARYLHNNRRTDRTPAYRIPFRKRGRSVIYKGADLVDFVTWEKRRRYGIAKVPGRSSSAITVKLDPYCMEALEALQRRTEMPAAEILESLFPALLLDLRAAMDAVDQAPPDQARAALQAWFDSRKGAQR